MVHRLKDVGTFLVQFYRSNLHLLGKEWLILRFLFFGNHNADFYLNKKTLLSCLGFWKYRPFNESWLLSAIKFITAFDVIIFYMKFIIKSIVCPTDNGI